MRGGVRPSRTRQSILAGQQCPPARRRLGTANQSGGRHSRDDCLGTKVYRLPKGLADNLRAARLNRSMASSNFDIASAKERCKKFRRRILDVSQKVGALHIAPSFSCLELVDTAYFCLM